MDRDRENSRLDEEQLRRFLDSQEEKFAKHYNKERSWANLVRRIRVRRLRRIGVYSAVASVALVVLLFTVGPQLSKVWAPQIAEVATERSFPEVGGRKAVLTLDDGSEIDLAVQSERIWSKDSSVVISNTPEKSITYESQSKAKAALQFNTLTVERGGEYQLYLPDGTFVMLNSESSLRYPIAFGDKREVFLTGEAYFEVEADPKHPFIVTTGEHRAEALGTVFNVSAYSKSKIETTLAEGAMKVSAFDSSVVLKPNQQSTVGRAAEKIEVKSVDAKQFTSWTQGLYEFQRTSLEDIVSQLERWYDVEFEFKDSDLRSKTFGGVIFRNEELSFAIEVIERVSDVRFSREDDVIYIDTK